MNKEKQICKLCGRYRTNIGFKVGKKCAEKLKIERRILEEKDETV
jgi:hypothetical protein